MLQNKLINSSLRVNFPIIILICGKKQKQKLK